MSEQAPSQTPELLDSRAFLELFGNAPSGAAYRLMDGILDDPSAPDLVVSTYEANAIDLLEVMGPKHREHGIASFSAESNPVPQAQVKIVYPDSDRWSKDPGYPAYQAKRVQIEAPDGSHTPASLVRTMDGLDLIDCWLVKDGREQPA